MNNKSDYFFMEDTGEAFRTSSRMRSCTPFVQEKGESNLPALSSDILEFISNQDDFYEDAAYAHADAV